MNHREADAALLTAETLPVCRDSVRYATTAFRSTAPGIFFTWLKIIAHALSSGGESPCPRPGSLNLPICECEAAPAFTAATSTFRWDGSAIGCLSGSAPSSTSPVSG